MTDDLKLTKARQTGVKVLAIVAAVLGVTATTIAFMRSGQLVVVGASAGVFAALAFYAFRLGGNLAARLSVTVAVIGQIAVILAAMAGHAWQLDVHMVFFAALAMLTLMTCPASLLVGAGVTAVHHLALTFFWPSMVYPSVDLMENIGRTVLHAVVVIAETGILLTSVMTTLRQMNERNKEQAVLSETMEALKAEKTGIEAREKAQADVVSTLHERLTRIANGNLDASINHSFDKSYEALRKSFNDAVSSLSGIITSVTSVSSQIEVDSRELAEVSNSVAHSTEKQAGALQGVTDAVEQIADAMNGAVEKAKSTQERFDHTRNMTSNGAEVVRQAVSTMDEIEASSSQIDHVVTLIEDIAFQTNLLALNAGVEAARAGEAGAGFAIVASEVRELAHRSAEAAQNINKLISESNGHVTNGVALVRQVGEALEAILGDVNQVSGNVAEISDVSSEQAQSVEKIRGSMQTIGSETQANAARAEEASAATSSLDMAVDRLVDALAGFRVAAEAPQTGDVEMFDEDGDDEAWAAA
ncbi:methyl-accepting chemotaxis protein [uncultured Shimia sp.]|uniref:methyl-accepting chemotaxis protein n=1 Tax=uncultured Shimia sp. TaxID=573152 RepID=UPI0026269277|nr:methyl-accepting chemotaxis protein [uncultured Shimia sp.]